MKQTSLEGSDAQIDVGRCIANYLIVLLHAGGAAVQYGRRLRFDGKWWLVLGCLCMVLDLFDVLGWGSVGGRNLRMLLKVPMYFCLVDKLDAKQLLAASWFRIAREASFFVFVAHFFFCSIWIHSLGGFFSAWPVGNYLMPFVLFMVPGLTTTLLAWKIKEKLSS